MNRFRFFFAIVAFSLLAGCRNNEEPLVRKCAQAYLNAVGNYQIEAAEPYATEETINTYLKFVEEEIMPNLAPGIIAEATPATITINEITFTSDTTAIASFTKTSPKDIQSATIDLLKRGKQWKVHFVPEIPSIFTHPKPVTEQNIPPKINIDKK